jgi:hypothetical protein
MTKDDAMARALAAFDRIVADRERSNITAMLADGVDPDVLDAIIREAREIMRQSRTEYVAFVTEMLDAQW